MKLALAALVLTLAPAVQAQVLDLTKRYNVLAHKNLDDLRRDLSKAGQQGFRVVTASTTGTSEFTLLIEKSEGVFEYIVLASTDTQVLERSLTRNASQGFHLLANTVTSKSRRLGSAEIVMVLEKGPDTKGNWDYLLLDTSFGESLQVTLSGAVDKGYRVLGMVRKGDQAVLIMGKPAA